MSSSCSKFECEDLSDYMHDTDCFRDWAECAGKHAMGPAVSYNDLSSPLLITCDICYRVFQDYSSATIHHAHIKDENGSSVQYS